MRCAPHVFDRDILPGIVDQQLPLAGPMGVDKPPTVCSVMNIQNCIEANDAERVPVAQYWG